MWKTLVDRFDRIFDQTAPFSPPPSKPAFFTKLFQRSPELGNSFSLLYGIKRLIDRIKTGIKQVQVDQEDLMAKLRQSVPTIDNINLALIRRHVFLLYLWKHSSRGIWA